MSDWRHQELFAKRKLNAHEDSRSDGLKKKRIGKSKATTWAKKSTMKKPAKGSRPIKMEEQPAPKNPEVSSPPSSFDYFSDTNKEKQQVPEAIAIHTIQNKDYFLEVAQEDDGSPTFSVNTSSKELQLASSPRSHPQALLLEFPKMTEVIMSFQSSL
ncbi:hypothetical protein F511_09979 [Dorcoceras hygrometricum]|uniref:Uncharacterized protein n=1 Tax=Dorcoceras hygrometricum TaxID=472368 RepID=A0A2Z7D3F5_9LAMI|nr:hypothetical protein F511_09979 [Dorcoceras hygrometricum]